MGVVPALGAPRHVRVVHAARLRHEADELHDEAHGYQVLAEVVEGAALANRYRPLAIRVANRLRADADRVLAAAEVRVAEAELYESVTSL